MNKTYQPVEIEVIFFQAEDVITTSGDDDYAGEED